MIVTGMQRWDSTVLIGGNKWRWYRIDHDAETAAMILDAMERFWTDHILADVPPQITGSESATKWLAQRFATHDAEMVQGSAEHYALAQRHATLAAEIKRLDAEKTEAENVLKLAIGDHAGIEGNGWKVSWKRASGGSVAWKAVAQEFSPSPELIAAHTGEPSRRFLVSGVTPLTTEG